MPLVKVYSTAKRKVSEMELDERIFNVQIKDHLLHDVVRMQFANRRAGTASTKGRSMVRGGGRKPYRQKGTGRSRAGTIRSPLWRGGGVIFGPAPRDFGFNLPKKVKRQALRVALSARAAEGKLLVLNQFELKEIRTKSFVEILGRLGMEKALIVIGQENCPGLAPPRGRGAFSSQRLGRSVERREKSLESRSFPRLAVNFQGALMSADYSQDRGHSQPAPRELRREKRIEHL